MLYSTVVVFAIHQHKSVIITYMPSLLSISPHPVPPLSVITEHQPGLLILDSSFLLVICFTHDSVYMSMQLSQFAKTRNYRTLRGLILLSL